MGVHMWNYIVELIREFESAHGRRPQLVYLNARHMRQLMAECPDLFDKERGIPLGFHLVILPERELHYPKAACLPRRDRTKPTARPKKGPALISWASRQQKRTEG